MKTLLAVVPLVALGPCVVVEEPPPPMAHAEVTCLDQDCTVVELSGENSVGADVWTWTVDGVEQGNDPTFQLDVLPDSVTVVELRVDNASGSDSTIVALLAGGMSNDPTLPAVGDGNQSTVVAGIYQCGGQSVIATVGGCLLSPLDIEQRFGLIRAGGVQLDSTMRYERAPNEVTAVGDANAVVWRNSNTGDTHHYVADASGLVGPAAAYGPLQALSNVIDPQQDHVSSFFTVGAGERLIVTNGHPDPAGGDEGLTALEGLSIDCTNGSPVVTSGLFD
ncbi:MAG: hypothetical protein KC621_21010 [Myxococcales bacterium]|nr:hypothetical protein [Myxococcales bacterium]